MESIPFPHDKFPHEIRPVIHESALEVGKFYASVIGYKNGDQWVMAPAGSNGRYSIDQLDRLRMGSIKGTFLEKDGIHYKFSLNGNTVLEQAKTYVLNVLQREIWDYAIRVQGPPPISENLGWMPVEDRERHAEPTRTYLEVYGQTCFIEVPPPSNLEQVVIRTPLVGHYYKTCTGRAVGYYPNTMYYATSQFTYLGKYLRHKRSGAGNGGGGDGVSCDFLFEADDGTIIYHPLNYEGTTCFQEVSAI
jgi:hypothetical protein